MEESDHIVRMRLLLQAWQTPDICALREQCDSALTRVRFHHSLRRRWQEVRALTNIYEAAYLSRWEGSPISTSDLRDLTMREGPHEAGTLTTGEQFALGIWRSQWHVMTLMPPLNRTPTTRPASQPALPNLVAGLHRDITSLLATSGYVERSRIAVPASPRRLARVLSYVTGDVPAVVSAAAVWADCAAHPLFEPGSSSVGAAVARWILTVRGTDPTGVVTVSKLSATDPQRVARIVSGWAAPDHSYAHDVLAFFLSSLIAGVDDALDIALSVQAGHPRQ